MFFSIRMRNPGKFMVFFERGGGDEEYSTKYIDG